MPRLRKPPAALPEVEDHSPPTDDVVIDLGEEDTPDVEVELSPAAPEPTSRTPDLAPPSEDDALKRAVEATARAEELQRQAQRDRDEAIRQAREREQELIRERNDRESAEYNSVLTAIAAEQSNLEKAEADYTAAASAGDWAIAAKAQRAMSLASARLDRLEEGKQAYDSRREEPRREPDRQPPQQQLAAQPSFEDRIAGLPVAAQTWLRKHPEFITDPTKTAEIGSVHDYVLKRKGVQQFSAAYFDALDTEFGFKTPEPQPEPVATPQIQRRSVPMSAPVSRDVPGATGQRNSRNITLTAEERIIARNSFTAPDMTNEQKELLYAQNKAKLHRQRANGEYRHTTEQTG